MKKIGIALSLCSLVLAVLALNSVRVFANDWQDRGHRDNGKHFNGDFNTDKQLTRSACGDKLGKPIIDVTENVQNDTDSGFGANVYFPSAGNYWNVESYTRHIQVWPTGETSWCAIVLYDNGHFNAFYKQTGPAGTGIIGSDVDGEMHGGYRATFNGTLLSTTLWSKNGFVGTFNYDCDIAGNCGPGRVDWVGQYFGPGYTGFDQPWWGWQYKAGGHGTWVNALEGSTGNIL
ncbi:MAG TPA: hypothetical protein VMR81_02360 [Patescibacteria group bacterium]|nr:hypothetical protein [Patescibacteria group bacterium]